MLDMGVIRPSDTPWASVLVLAHKKNGKLCFCIDVRKINERTIKDSYAIPGVEETLDCSNGMLLCLIGFEISYWQAEMDKVSHVLTALYRAIRFLSV